MLVALSRTRRTMQLRNLSWSRVVLQTRSSSIYSKPPKTKIGPGQTFFIMSVFSMALLLPAGWILHHLPNTDAELLLHPPSQSTNPSCLRRTIHLLERRPDEDTLGRKLE